MVVGYGYVMMRDVVTGWLAAELWLYFQFGLWAVKTAAVVFKSGFKLRSMHTLENFVIFCNKIRESEFLFLLTFTDRQVVAPLWFALPDIAVDLLAAHQLVSLSAPEG